MTDRSTQKEKLDDLSLEGPPLHGALKSLEWINRWLGNHRSIIKVMHRFFREEKRALKIIDLGCGGGDLVLEIARSMRAEGFSFSITGIDGNMNSLDYARAKCAAWPEISFIQADILADDFDPGACDLLITSHFIYHFTEEQLVRFINRVMPSVSTAFICSELERSRLALALFRMGSIFLPISKLARQDGLLAIQRAFTKKEWLSLLAKTKVAVYEFKRVPFFRIRLMLFPVNKI